MLFGGSVRTTPLSKWKTEGSSIGNAPSNRLPPRTPPTSPWGGIPVLRTRRVRRPPTRSQISVLAAGMTCLSPDTKGRAGGEGTGATSGKWDSWRPAPAGAPSRRRAGRGAGRAAGRWRRRPRGAGAPGAAAGAGGGVGRGAEPGPRRWLRPSRPPLLSQPGRPECRARARSWPGGRPHCPRWPSPAARARGPGAGAAARSPHRAAAREETLRGRVSRAGPRRSLRSGQPTPPSLRPSGRAERPRPAQVGRRPPGARARALQDALRGKQPGAGAPLPPGQRPRCNNGRSPGPGRGCGQSGAPGRIARQVAHPHRRSRLQLQGVSGSPIPSAFLPSHFLAPGCSGVRTKGARVYLFKMGNKTKRALAWGWAGVRPGGQGNVGEGRGPGGLRCLDAAAAAWKETARGAVGARCSLASPWLSFPQV